MSDDWLNYVNDPRTICKYGSKCYQMNPQHNTTYKHPPPSNLTTKWQKPKQHRSRPYSRIDKQNDNNGTRSLNQEKGKYDSTSLRSKEDANATVKQIIELKTTVEETTLNLKQGQVNSNENEPSLESKNQEVDHCSIFQDNQIFYDSTTNHDVLKELFLVEMPSDFFKFYDCLNVDNKFEKTLSSVNLEAIGPYDLLLGKLPKLNDKALYLSHWRFFYDPPEFQVTFQE